MTLKQKTRLWRLLKAIFWPLPQKIALSCIVLLLCSFQSVPPVLSGTATVQASKNTIGVSNKKANLTTPVRFAPLADSAAKFLWVRETRPNRGPGIDAMLRRVGLPPGHPWCAAFVSLLCDTAGVTWPTVRSAASQAFVVRGAIDAARILNGRDSVRRGDIVIWRNGNTWTGHIGVATDDWRGSSGPTIEGNTSAGTAGSQRDGNGVYRRTRKILRYDYFRIRYIVRPKYGHS